MAGNFAGNFRGQTFNALMQPRAVYDRPLTFRGTIAPLGTYQNPDGTEDVGFAWPGIITEPLKALQRLHENSYTEDGRLGMPNPEYQGNKDDALTALLSIYGGNALNPAAAIPKNSVGVLAGRKALDGAKAPKGITAYHGSPHDFDKFDLSKIGTGEGAQAYGHGLYFAENEGVAKSYKDALSQDGLGQVARGWLRQNGGDVDKTIDFLRGRVARTYGSGQPIYHTSMQALDELENVKATGITQGHMYQVRINANPEDFLDWDKLLSQQSESVKSRLGVPAPDKIAEADRLAKEIDRMNRIIDGQGYGRDPHPDEAMRIKDDLVRKYLEIDPSESAWWKFDAKDAAARPEAAAKMREAGIPGIKYLDRTSRAAGEGSRNYVVFDDSIIDILKKYGLAGGAIGAGSLFDFNTDQQY